MKIINGFLFKLIRKLLSKIIIKDLINPSNINLASNYIYTQDIEGDYLEFGCFRGESFIESYFNINKSEKFWMSENRKKKAFTNNYDELPIYKKNYNRRFLAFDSFAGLPKPKKIDSDHPLFREGRYDCSKEEFIKIIKKANLDLNQIEIIDGFYEQSLTVEIKKKLKIDKAAIIMIDCDYYDSTVFVLRFITDLIQNGTIIIFDDWYNYKANPRKGEQLACREWLEKNPNIELIEYGNNLLTQKMFIINLRSS